MVVLYKYKNRYDLPRQARDRRKEISNVGWRFAHAAAAKGNHKAIGCLIKPYRSLPPPPPAAAGAKAPPPPLPKLLLSKFGKAKEVSLHAACRAGHTETVGLILDAAAGYGAQNAFLEPFVH